MRPKELSVGVLVPENNTTVERELPKWLPAGSRLSMMRIPRGKGLLTADTISAYTASALVLAEEVAREEFDVVAYACTAASFILGPAGDRQIAVDLARITHKPVATIAASMIAELTALDLHRIALITPYSKAVNEQLKAYIASAGMEVAAFDSFYAANTEELGRISADDVAKLARATMTDACEALFIACAQLPTHDVLGPLSGSFDRPVLSSVQTLAQGILAATDTARAAVA